MKCDSQYFFDRTLSTGCSSSCAIFEAFSSALKWLSKHLFHASGIVHSFDDFLFIAPTREKCQADLQNFLRMCDFLRVPIAEEKTIGPFTTLQFAGITLDSVRHDARLPDDKLQKHELLLHQFNLPRKVSLRELQSLLGLLNFTCSIVIPGRAFLRRIVWNNVNKFVHHGSIF